MDSSQLNWVANFIWGVADDVLRDLYLSHYFKQHRLEYYDRLQAPESSFWGTAGADRRELFGLTYDRPSTHASSPSAP